MTEFQNLPPQQGGVDLTNDSFSRWLRAQRPPMDLFLSLDAEQQETLALLGDEYMVDLAVTLGEAVRDPTTAGARAGDAEAEADLLTRLVAQRMAQPAPSPPPGQVRSAQTMSGLGDRRKAAREKARKAIDILGRPGR